MTSIQLSELYTRRIHQAALSTQLLTNHDKPLVDHIQADNINLFYNPTESPIPSVVIQHISPLIILCRYLHLITPHNTYLTLLKSRSVRHCLHHYSQKYLDLWRWSLFFLVPKPFALHVAAPTMVTLHLPSLSDACCLSPAHAILQQADPILAVPPKWGSFPCGTTMLR